LKSVFVISIANPILVGIYENNILKEIISKDGMTSDVLPLIVRDILNKHSIDELIYINGPGSYMAIKIAYIFLKTIAITHKIQLKAVEGFNVNNNTPIKALGKKYFIKKDDEISLDFLDENTKLEEFTLPTSLEDLKYEDDTLPQYHLPAIT
jgi:tRNA A37 threonylcarbamoyladenosine modification protein TsaB